MADALAGTLAVDLELNDAKFTSAVKKAGDAVATESFRMNTAIKSVQQTVARGPGFNNRTWMIGNLGNQVGDFAVQLASGTSALRAFTQQAPQVLGGFGAIGAVIGGITAVLGAGIAAWTGYGKAAGQTAEQVKAVAAALEKVNAIGMAKAQKAALDFSKEMADLVQTLTTSATEQREAVEKLEADLVNATEQMERFKAIAATNPTQRFFAEDAAASVEQLTLRLGAARDALATTNEAIDKAVNAKPPVDDAATKKAAAASVKAETDARKRLTEQLQAEQTAYEQMQAIKLEMLDLDVRRDAILKRESDAAQAFREQADAVKQSTVEWDALTESYRINDKELRTVQETQRILNGDWAVGYENARKLAEANVAAADDLTREQQRVGTELKRSQKLYDDIGNIGTNAFDRIADASSNAILSGQGDAITWQNIWQSAIASVMADMLKLLAVEPLKKVGMAGLQFLGNGVGDFFTNQHNIGVANGLTSGFTQDNSLFGFASGGRPDPGAISIVGEKGPELFVPDVAGTVVSNDNSQPWLRGGNDGDVTVIINGAPEGTNARAEQSSGPGGKTIEVWLDEAVGKLVGTPGSRTGRAMTNVFGARRTLTGRG